MAWLKARVASCKDVVDRLGGQAARKGATRLPSRRTKFREMRTAIIRIKRV